MSKKTHGIEDLTMFAMEVIKNLGEKALSYYGKGKPQIQFDENLVTEAELNLTEFFSDQLHSHFPNHLMFKDNLEHTDYSHEESRYLWIFDPIDGVANFQAGIPIWGMSLALIENFWPVFGAFYMPATGDLFHAQADKEAFQGNEKIRISSSGAFNDESLLLTYSRFHNHYSSTFPGKIRALGCTSAHICYIAMGRADAAVITNESFQDLAAARVIIEAAGGKIFKVDGSEFFLNEHLNGERIKEHLLVGNPDNFSQLKDYLQKIS